MWCGGDGGDCSDCQLLPLPLPWSLGACWAKDRTKRVIFISNINIMDGHNSVVLEINSKQEKATVLKILDFQ